MTDAQARNLGALIHRARLAKGLSFRTLAALTDIPLSSLKRFEDGVLNDPSPAQIARIAEALGIDPVRIDRASNNHLQNSMPTIRTYLRSTAGLSPAGLDAVERVVADLVATDAAARRRARDSEAGRGGTP